MKDFDISQTENTTKEISYGLAEIESFLSFGEIKSREIRDLYNERNYGSVYSMGTDGHIIENQIEKIELTTGKQEVYLVNTSKQHKIRCTLNYKFPTPKGELSLKELLDSKDPYLYCLQEISDYNLHITTDKIISASKLGIYDVYYISLIHPYHNVIVEGGIVTSSLP